MRTIVKGPTPVVLVTNGEAWTAAYVAAHGTDGEKACEKWRHPKIREALNDETFGKCAYCEALMGDISYAHVEHLIPKAIHPELAHSWENLTWACPRCNTNKGAFFGGTNSALLSPYEEGIQSHINFFGAYIAAALGSSRGEITVKQLQLNRMVLVDSRMRRLNSINEMLERWHAAGDHTMREVLAAAIRIDAEDGEFTSMVKEYLHQRGFPVEPNASEGAA